MDFSKTPPTALIKATRALDESRASAGFRKHHIPLFRKPQRPSALSKQLQRTSVQHFHCVIGTVVGGFTEVHWVQTIRKL